jgi:uncharacterized membrane protein YhaH (DUF805 family)
MFIFAGGMKLITPLAALEQQAQMSGMFLRFIGICEFLGALGLILPGLTRTSHRAHAAGRVGSHDHHDRRDGRNYRDHWALPMAIMPFVVGVFSALVAIGRWSVAPLRTRAHA